MSESQPWRFLTQLDEELLKGGVILSEWSVFLIRESDTSFARGAYLASILTAVAAAETHLRWLEPGPGKKRLIDLIQSSGLERDLAHDLQELRKYRNKWVHIDDPSDDVPLVQNAAGCEAEIENMARLAVRTLRRVIYHDQCV